MALLALASIAAIRATSGDKCPCIRVKWLVEFGIVQCARTADMRTGFGTEEPGANGEADKDRDDSFGRLPAAAVRRAAHGRGAGWARRYLLHDGRDPRFHPRVRRADAARTRPAPDRAALATTVRCAHAHRRQRRRNAR